MTSKTSDILMLGDAYRRRGNRPFGIHLRDRLLHTYIIGQTGTGKTTLLQTMIKQDNARGRGLCLIDPHGDLAETLAPGLGPKDIYWDVADAQSPYGYNPITPTTEELRPLVASGLIDALKKQWAEAWGVRMEHLLRYAVHALLEQRQADLQDIVRLFIDRTFRQQVLDHVSDPQTLQFWTREFPSMNYKTAVDGVAPIANKLGAFLAHPIIRKAVTEPVEPLRFRKLMDEGRTIIVNLAKGRIGTDTANVLGGLLVASLFNAALSRHDQPEAVRRPFFLYVDEFHSFTTLAFAAMLAEVRKYGLGTILAHQYAEQAERAIEHAILGNVGSLISFRLGPLDAPRFAPFFTPFEVSDLVGLANFDAYARIMVAGERTRAFSMRTWPPKRPFRQAPPPS